MLSPSGYVPRPLPWPARPSMKLTLDLSSLFLFPPSAPDTLTSGIPQTATLSGPLPLVSPATQNALLHSASRRHFLCVSAPVSPDKPSLSPPKAWLHFCFLHGSYPYPNAITYISDYLFTFCFYPLDLKPLRERILLSYAAVSAKPRSGPGS